MAKATIAFEGIIGGVMAFVALIILIGFVVMVGRNVNSATDRQICKDSVSQVAAWQYKNLMLPASVINCPAKYQTIYSDRITSDYRGKKSTEKLSKDNRETKIKRSIANEIFYCYDNFGQGKLDILGNLDYKLPGQKNTNYCSVCAVVQFEGSQSSIEKFDKYLSTAKIPSGPKKDDYTYYEFFVDGKISPEDLAKINANHQVTIDPSETYAVILVYNKGLPVVENSLGLVDKFSKSYGAKGMIVAGAVATVGFVAAGAVGGVAVVGTTAAFIIKGTVLAGVGLAATTAGIETYTGHNPIKDYGAFTFFGKYDEKTLKDLGCDTLPFKDKLK